jgi:hypothetical protein
MTTTTTPSAIQTETRPDTGATTAGMICLLIGSVAVAALPFVGWLFGGPLFLVAFILAIVAMSKNNIGQGIVLLLATLTVPVVAQIFGFIAWAALGAAAGSSTGGH